MTFKHKLAHRLALLRDRSVAVAVAGLALLWVASCEKPLTVSEPNPSVAQLVVSPKVVSLQENQSQDFTAVGFTTTGDTAQIGVTWSVTGGTIDTSSSGKRHYGHYKNASCGNFQVAATSHPGLKTDTATVAVTCPVPVATVSVAPPTATVQVGQTLQLSATPQDANGTPLSGRTIAWSSDNATVAAVSASGLVTAKVAGPATITATSEGQSGTSSVTVTNVPVASVSVSPASASVSVSQTTQLTATPKDANGTPLTGRTIGWVSSNTGVATVNGSGLVTGVTVGSATISATSEGKSGSATVIVTSGSGTTVTLVGAGDIADCDAEPTAALLDTIPGTVFTAGDNAYPDGSAANYAQCYDPSWGRHKTRTRPAPGNHEYHTSGAATYYNYFGANAGPSGLGYYSYDLGAWHIISLNSQVDYGVGIDATSAQGQWLRADLAASTKRCILAYWHYPRFSSGANHGSDADMDAFWAPLYQAGATIVISAHDHEYERFAPQAPDGTADPVRGIREFVVGTGGASLYSFATPLPNSEVRNATTHGVLKLTLSDGSYTWQFVPIAGDSFTDSGGGTCH